MAAIITESHRRQLAGLLYEDFLKNNTSYFIGIGQSTEWVSSYSAFETAPFPSSGILSERVIKDNLTEIVRVASTASARCIPNFEPESGIYKEYNPYDSSCYYPTDEGRPSFVINQLSGDVFVLLHRGDNATEDFLDVPSLPKRIHYINDSIWMHVGNTNLTSIVNSNRFKVLSADLNTTSHAQILSEYKSLSGSGVYGFHIEKSGQGFLSAPDIILYGYNDNDVQTELGRFKTILDPDTEGIIGFDIKASDLFDITDQNVNFKYKGYKNYSVFVADVNNIITSATVYPKVAPENGFGAKNDDIMPNWYVGFAINTNTADAVRNSFSQYAQVSLWKNIDFVPGQNQTLSAYNMLYGIQTTDDIGSVERGDFIITGGANKTYVGRVDNIDLINGFIYYINAYPFGYGGVIGGSVEIVKSLSGTSGFNIAVTNTTKPAVKHNSGNIVFVDNRSTIIRTESQNEELKIIIQL